MFGEEDSNFETCPPCDLCAGRSGAFCCLPRTALSQQIASTDSAATRHNYWRNFALGFGASILAHETAHVLAAFALGAHPTIAFDKGRPTVFSGIDIDKHPHKQFAFSASGLTTQAVINELILDVRHSRGSAIERGILAGGIGTTLFYITIGRNGSISDISYMERTSSLSKTQLSLIFRWCVRNPGVANIPGSGPRPLFSEAHAGWIGRGVLVLN